MTPTQQQQTLAAADCEVRSDSLTRQLYATDASLHQIEPLAVAFPRSAEQAAAVLCAAGEAGVAVTPRGAGSGLVGGAIGDGLIVDFARHNRRMIGLDLERRTARVGAGVVLDQLNAFLKPHGYCFGPDVATSSRATLGGMIANDSSGARTPRFGTTADHVASLELVLADGKITTIGPGHESLRPVRELADDLVRRSAAEIAARMPDGLTKRWPGYGISRLLREPGNLNHILAGSEGTLAGIWSAELRIVPLPREKGLGLVFFASVTDAMQATVELLELNPVAIEHVDRVLFDQTRGQIQFKAARDLLELDARPCEAFLIVEFFDDVPDRLAALAKKRLGLRTAILTRTAEMNLVWELRKSGLSLLTGCPGTAKPATCIEDTAVRPERLPEYVAALQGILKPLQVEACFYGHAASGLLHVRPVLDLHTIDGLRKLRQITTEVSALVRQFHGSFASEHGVGIARTEFMREQLGEELLGVMREVKRAFDPKWVLNPGKILGSSPSDYRLDTHLRMGAGHELHASFAPVLAFAAKDGSFIRNLEQCNGCGGCLKQAPGMCPTFIATGEEIMSTRGRANAVRAALEGRAGMPILSAASLEAALGNCLSCKACVAECPSNVDMALLKAELTHARHQAEGVPWLAQVVRNVDLLGKWGTVAPGLANALISWPWFRRRLEGLLGLDASRPMPPFAGERFDIWFAQRGARGRAPRGPVILWDDCFVRYHEPHIGRAAVTVLEAAGFEVRLLSGRECCGRPAFSQGCLDKAASLGAHNVDLLQRAAGEMPVIFIEPSCWSMFASDYRELKVKGAAEVAGRCFLFEKFMDDLLRREPDALRFRAKSGRVAIHAHCHAKALTNPAFMPGLISRLPERSASLLEAGCCGMAGAFGMMAGKQELSRQVAEPLMACIHRQPAGTVILAAGTSCRHQIEHLSPIHPKHPAEFLAEALEI